MKYYVTFSILHGVPFCWATLSCRECWVRKEPSSLLYSPHMLVSIAQSNLLEWTNRSVAIWLSLLIFSFPSLSATNLKFGICWYGERVVMGIWMVTTLVLMRSYAGNLISLLAVKYIPQPYQSLRDVLDDPVITMIWQKNSANEQYLRVIMYFIIYNIGVFH